MKITELDFKHPLLENDDFILMKENSRTYSLWKKSSFEEIARIDLNDDYVVPVSGINSIILNHPKLREVVFYSLDNLKSNRLKTESQVIFESTNKDFYGVNYSTYQTSLLDTNIKEKFLFERISNTVDVPTDLGLVRLSDSDNESCYIEMYGNGNEDLSWRIDLETHHSSYKLFGNYIFLISSNGPTNTVTCVDLQKQVINWEVQGEWSPWILIDPDAMSVVISFNRQYYEVEIENGNIISEFVLNRNRDDFFPERIMKLTATSIFFYSALKENVLGELDRKTGEVKWEKSFVPDGCQKLNIWSWFIVKGNEHLIYVYDRENPRLILLSEDPNG